MNSLIQDATSRARHFQRPVTHALAQAGRTARQQLDRIEDSAGSAGDVIGRGARDVAKQGQTALRRAPVMTGFILLAVAAGGVLLANARSRSRARKVAQRLAHGEPSGAPTGGVLRSTGQTPPQGKSPARAIKARTTKARQDARLDEGLEESFPASDPVSVTRSGGGARDV